MVNGLYVTKAASPADAYRNYSNYYGNNNVNYSEIQNNNTIRFVTFKYTVNRSNTPTNGIGVRINYGSGPQFPISSQLFTNNILFQYKINGYQNDSGTYTGEPNSNATSTNQTTVWLNGNNVIPLSGFPTLSFTTPGTGGLNSGQTNTQTETRADIQEL
jgi:hypothetical protein